MKNIIFILVLFSFFGCKKDKLEGDKSIFIGKWKWVYSDVTHGVCNPPEYNTQINPTSENINYSVEFIKCGKIVYYKNGIKQSKDRLVFSQFEIDESSLFSNEYYTFSVSGDNDLDKAFAGYVNPDTLILTGYYFFFDESRNCNGCCYYLNYFIRE